MKLLGIVLVILGIVGLVYGGITWTTKDKVVELGPLQVTRDKAQSAAAPPPIVGGVCLAAGVVLLITASRREA